MFDASFNCQNIIQLIEQLIDLSKHSTGFDVEVITTQGPETSGAHSVKFRFTPGPCANPPCPHPHHTAGQ